MGNIFKIRKSWQRLDAALATAVNKHMGLLSLVRAREYSTPVAYSLHWSSRENAERNERHTGENVTVMM